MADKIWNAQTEKLVVSIGMGISGWKILADSFTQIPALPIFFTNTLGMPGLSLLTIGAAASIYGIWVWYNKY